MKIQIIFLMIFLLEKIFIFMEDILNYMTAMTILGNFIPHKELISLLHVIFQMIILEIAENPDRYKKGIIA